jgi:ornithine carbamoyltransferase
MLDEFVRASAVPVINAGSDVEHPCQALGDLYTIKQAGKLKPGNLIVFVGDPTDAVANSLAIGALKLGLKFTYSAPKGYEARNKKTVISNDLHVVKNAAIVYTNAWAREREGQDPKLVRDLLPYQVNKELLKHAPDALVMHPLPASRGLEITDDALDSKNSVVWKQVKNRLYVQKAVIEMLEK